MKPNAESDNTGSKPPLPPSIVFKEQVNRSVFNLGPQQGVVSTGDHNVIHQTIAPLATAAPIEFPGPPSAQAEPPEFQSEPELAAFLQDWVRGQWKADADGGTGRSGNAILKARWQGQPALLKVSADAAGLRAESAHLAALRDLGVGLSVARLFARAETTEGDDRWMAYLMEPVGEMSLRDYLFTATPSPRKFLESLGQGLAELYCRTARTTARDFVADYVRAIRQSVERARGYATFRTLAPHFESAVVIKGVSLAGPGTILAGLEERLKQGDAALRALNPAHDCHVHGDLHFENVRINPAEAALGRHWLIDPKEFEQGDYVYDLAKLLTSLTGHAHADIGENEKGNPRLKWTAAVDGRIDFNCILTPRQVDGWREGLAAIETLACGVAPRLEAMKLPVAEFARIRGVSEGGVQPATARILANAATFTGNAQLQRPEAADAEAVTRMKLRLLLALARHYFSAVRFFLRPEAQWLLFARGTQFLAMFQAALDGKGQEEWDLFRVCGGDGWLETP